VIRACLHVLPAARHDPAVTITHGYRIGQNTIEKPIEMKGPGGYTVECDGDVENVFIRIQKPSGRTK